MPDLAAMMRNPQLMAMAQQMMSNGGLECVPFSLCLTTLSLADHHASLLACSSLMNNPAIRGMAERMQSSGQPPSMFVFSCSLSLPPT